MSDPTTLKEALSEVRRLRDINDRNAERYAKLQAAAKRWKARATTAEGQLRELRGDKGADDFVRQIRGIVKKANASNA